MYSLTHVLFQVQQFVSQLTVSYILNIGVRGHKSLTSCMHVCMFLCMYVCMCVFIYVCVSVCVKAHIFAWNLQCQDRHTHTHAHTQELEDAAQNREQFEKLSEVGDDSGDGKRNGGGGDGERIAFVIMVMVMMMVMMLISPTPSAASAHCRHRTKRDACSETQNCGRGVWRKLKFDLFTHFEYSSSHSYLLLPRSPLPSSPPSYIFTITLSSTVYISLTITIITTTTPPPPL